MAVYEWEGKIRITIGSLSRAAKLDLWIAYTQSDLYNNNGNVTPLDNARHIMETDAMVTAASTKQIEVCIKGKWQTVEDSLTVEHDSEQFELQFPPSADMINHLPSHFADWWIEQATNRNGGLTANMAFFSSLAPKNGQTNSEPISEKQP